MDIAEVVRRFVAAWNTDDEAKRLRLLIDVCQPRAEFISNEGISTGLDAYCAAIGAFRRAFPRATVVAGPADAHHGYLRFRWRTLWNDGREPLFGDDFVELDADGCIQRIVSFNGGAAPP